MKTIAARTVLNPTTERLAYNITEAADLLGLSRVSIYRLIQRGLLKPSTALRHKLLPRAELERFLRETSTGVAA